MGGVTPNSERTPGPPRRAGGQQKRARGQVHFGKYPSNDQSRTCEDFRRPQQHTSDCMTKSFGQYHAGNQLHKRNMYFFRQPKSHHLSVLVPHNLLLGGRKGIVERRISTILASLSMNLLPSLITYIALFCMQGSISHPTRWRPPYPMPRW